MPIKKPIEQGMRVPESTIASSENKPIQGSVIGSQKDAASTKQISQKKIEANRRNALRSTGPKTQRGKRTVSRNATRHGLLARQAVITEGHGAENQQEFVELLLRLRKDYQPVGISEELLVERIAVCYWRLARVLRFEMGETRKHLDHVGLSHTLKKIDQANRNVILLQQLEFQHSYEFDTEEETLSMKEWLEATQNLQSALRTDPVGIKYLMGVLETTKVEIQQTGSLSNEAIQGLMSTIGLCDRSLMCTCISLTPGKDNPGKNGVPDPSTEEENTEKYQIAKKEFAIRLLQRRLKWLKLLLDSAETNRTLELDAQVRSLALPDEGATDRVLRYETHLDRQLYRAMDQLERLQRRRKGESIPPPLNFNLGGHSVFAKQSQ